MSEQERAPVEALSGGMPKLMIAAPGKVPVPECEHGTYCLSVVMRCRLCYPTPESFLQDRGEAAA